MATAKKKTATAKPKRGTTSRRKIEAQQDEQAQHREATTITVNGTAKDLVLVSIELGKVAERHGITAADSPLTGEYLQDVAQVLESMGFGECTPTDAYVACCQLGQKMTALEKKTLSQQR